MFSNLLISVILDFSQSQTFIFKKGSKCFLDDENLRDYSLGYSECFFWVLICFLFSVGYDKEKFQFGFEFFSAPLTKAFSR